MFPVSLITFTPLSFHSRSKQHDDVGQSDNVLGEYVTEATKLAVQCQGSAMASEREREKKRHGK